MHDYSSGLILLIIANIWEIVLHLVVVQGTHMVVQGTSHGGSRDPHGGSRDPHGGSRDPHGGSSNVVALILIRKYYVCLLPRHRLWH